MLNVKSEDKIIQKFKEFCKRVGGKLQEQKILSNEEYIACVFPEPMDVVIDLDLRYDLTKDLTLVAYLPSEEPYYREENEITEKFRFPADVAVEVNIREKGEGNTEVLYDNNVPFEPMYPSHVKLGRGDVRGILIHKTKNKLLFELIPKKD